MRLEELMRAVMCSITVACVRLFGRRGNATRRISFRIMAEILRNRVPDDPREALLEIMEPIAEVELDGDELRVRDCVMCMCGFLPEVATEEEMEIIQEIVPCPVVNLYEQLAELKGWDVRLVPVRTPSSGDTEPGSCVQRLEERA
ncbi:MAG: hypothetical protein ABGY09_01850 [Euryarchaeota archaeon]